MVSWESIQNSTLPLLATPAGAEVLETWAQTHREEILQRLYVHGAILFRGFRFDSPERFQDFAAIFCSTFSNYIGGNSPRTRVLGNVFTSTEYAHDQYISLHNESSYLPDMPAFILFNCVKPAQSGGETPLADSRRIWKRLDASIKHTFSGQKICYINTLHDGAGLGRCWKDTFGTGDPAQVESYLRDRGYKFRWLDDGRLQTSITAASTVTHPVTKETCWINQAEQWHISSLPDATQQVLLSLVSEEELPHHVSFEDGSRLRADQLAQIREIMRSEEQQFSWQKGDVLLCDNRLIMHGRTSYVGDRIVLAAMG